MDNVARVREAWRAWAASYEDRMVRLPTVQLGTLTMSSRAVHVARTVFAVRLYGVGELVA